MIPCPHAAPQTKIIVAFGQSNSANFGGTNGDRKNWGVDQYNAKQDVVILDWRTGQCFRANDPLPGADGLGASIWGRMGDELIARGLAKQVVVVSFGVGATTIADWTEEKIVKKTGEQLRQRLDKVSAALTTAGFGADFVAFQQGESDKLTSYELYRQSLEILADHSIAQFGQKLTVAISTLCQAPPRKDLTRAIRDVTGSGRANLGPDFDTEAVNVLDRFDRCHLSGMGLDKAAILWADSYEKIASKSRQ